jgi:hypothetical protein
MVVCVWSEDARKHSIGSWQLAATVAPDLVRINISSKSWPLATIFILKIKEK